MMLLRKIDPDGMFIEDVFAAAPAADLIATPVPGGFFWPRWDGAAWIEGGTPPVVDDAAQIALLQAAVQARLDAFAASRYYGSILSACSYVTSDVPQFAVDAACCVSARDATWAVCNQQLNDYAAGLIPMPTEAELLALLPDLVWPGDPA